MTEFEKRLLKELKGINENLQTIIALQLTTVDLDEVDALLTKAKIRINQINKDKVTKNELTQHKRD